MSLFDFIFSEKKIHRLSRHLAFWLLWFIYFTASYYHYGQAGLEKVEFELWNAPFFIKTALLLSLHVVTCYLFINYLMPQYLFTTKYAALALGILILGILILITSYFFHKSLFPVIDAAFNHTPVIENKNIWWTSIVSGLLSAPKVISAAAAIKLLKRWYLKQKEKERLEREKLITDLQLLKAQMHPEFLFSSLNNICGLTEKKETGKASLLLLKLADMLSYILYESDNDFISLEKEIKMIKDYLVLEKIRMGNQLELDLAVKGETRGIMITPLLLFSLIEECLISLSSNDADGNWLNLEFQTDPGAVTMKIIYGKTNEASVCEPREGVLANVIKRLDFFYPDKYELKTTVETDMVMINLKIMFKSALNKNRNNNYNEEQLAYATA